MPSTRSPADPLSRRRLLAALGSTLFAGLAGCSGTVPGTSPETLAVETSVTEGEDPSIHWTYPSQEGDNAGIGHADVSLQRIRTAEHRHPDLVLQFGSTVGGHASVPSSDFRPDWLRFEVWPPRDYPGRLDHSVRVEPPGQWAAFSTSYDIQGGTRRTAIELRNVDTQGTIQIPAVFDPSDHSLPDRLHCSFAAQVSQDGVFGRTARVRDEATLPIPSL
jgi:hypothetical protein